jgi:site-specific DNA-adenine methylase
MDECPIINFSTEDITFRNTDAIEVMTEYGQNDKAFIFLDPPYKGTYNKCFYKNYNFDIYEFLLKNNINDMTARVFLAVEDTPFIRDNFNKNYFYAPYGKRYENTHKTNHVLITQA